MTTSDENTKTPVLNNKSYDFAQNAVRIYLPALATLYAALATILGLPFAPQVVAVIGAFVLFLGSVLKISSNQFAHQPKAYDGAFLINETDPLVDNYKLKIDVPYDELSGQKEIVLKVIDSSDRG